MVLHMRGYGGGYLLAGRRHSICVTDSCLHRFFVRGVS